MAERIKVYVWRAASVHGAAATVFSAASLDAVAAVYGGAPNRGGMLARDQVWAAVNGKGGLAESFGGGAVFSDDRTGAYHVGVWGTRKASRFRNSLRRAGITVDLVAAPPPGRLAWAQTGRDPKPERV